MSPRSQPAAVSARTMATRRAASSSSSANSSSTSRSPSPSAVHRFLPLRRLLWAMTALAAARMWPRRAVVLLQAEGLGAREVLVEVQHVLDPCAAPGVDGLVVVAHGEDVAVAAREQLDQQQLQRVGVLELVHQHVTEALGVLVAHLLVLFQQVHRAQDQVVEVQGVAAAQGRLVVLEELGVLLLDEGAGLLGRLRRRGVVVLPAADHRPGGVGRELLGVDVALAHHALEQAHAVVGVEDGEARLDAHRLAVAAQDLQAGGVEGADPEGGPALAHGPAHPLAHLAGGPVGEGEGQDPARVHAALAQQPGDAGGQDPGLAAAGAGDHQHRSLGRGHRAALGVVEVGSGCRSRLLRHGPGRPPPATPGPLAVRISIRTGT